MEIWKTIPGYEGLYEASNLGNIRSLPKYNSHKTRLLKPTLNKERGRLSVILCSSPSERKRVSVHRLVAMAFVENPDPGAFTEINHKDENPLNNKADNLEWCDRWYNMHYNNLHDRITRPQRKGVVGVNSDGNIIFFNSLLEAEKNGYCRQTLSEIINGKRKKGNFYRGYFWEVGNANQQQG